MQQLLPGHTKQKPLEKQSTPPPKAFGEPRETEEKTQKLVIGNLCPQNLPLKEGESLGRKEWVSQVTEKYNSFQQQDRASGM